MARHKLTAEQQAIVEHDLGRHATVLAVAGSGKTTTMVHRIRFLVDQRVPDRGIRAVMYNKSAQEDFTKKLSAVGLSSVAVQTFHAMGNGILSWAHKEGVIPAFRLVTEGKEERELARRAIAAALSDADGDERKFLDAEEVLLAVSTWKSMLTPPEEAQHLQEPLFEAVYREFERIRHRENLITFDDQIYDAVRLLEREKLSADKLVNRLEHLILDEFQDVNHARLRLAKILAGTRAKVMVVGDDDQCIYEWQGARSSFIKRGFVTEFTDHPHATYKLTRSFRFGPLIAQVAANVIGHNTDRVDKDLVANDILRGGQVTLDEADEGGGVRQALPCLQQLVREGARPADIVVLVRKYSQANLLQSLLLARRLPYFVEDQRPLKDVFAVQVGLSYLEAARGLDEPLTAGCAEAAGFIVNRPQRYVKKAAFDTLLQRSRARTLAEVLSDGFALREAGIAPGAAEPLRALEAALRAARDGSASSWLAAEQGTQVPHTAGHALAILLERIPFEELFRSFEGQGAAEDDVGILHSLAVLLQEASVGLSEAKAYIDNLDPRQGHRDADCIRITSVFKAKGLEWDHVLLPDLVEGQTPDLRATVNVCVNRRDPGRAPDPTQTLESERRLFYVAVTRARKSLHLFADPDERRLLSRFVHEARIEVTVDAVGALQELVRGGEAARPAIGRLEAGARADARLREGLLKMLRRVTQEVSPDRHAVLGAATLAVNRISAAPFTYPHAYPEVQLPRPSVPDADTGLPF